MKIQTKSLHIYQCVPSNDKISFSVKSGKSVIIMERLVDGSQFSVFGTISPVTYNTNLTSGFRSINSQGYCQILMSDILEINQDQNISFNISCAGTGSMVPCYYYIIVISV